MRTALLFNRDFALLWHGQLVSQLGNQAFFVAATYLTLEATGSAVRVAAVMMASTLPLALVSPIGGAVADRHSRRAIIVATDVLRAIAVAAVGLFLIWTPADGATDVAVLTAAAAFKGVMDALFAPAAQAILPDLVPAERLAPANALTQMSKQACTLLGQAVGGVLYVTHGPAALLLFDAASFGYAGLSTWFVRADRRPSGEAGSPWSAARRYALEARDGVRYVWRQPRMRALLTVFAGVNVSFMPVFVLLPLYVRDTLGRGPEWYGFLLAASGAGALGGSAAGGAWLRTNVLRVPLLAGALTGVAASVLVLSAAAQPAPAAAAMAAIGGLASIINVMVITGFQTGAPEAVRGRVMALVVALSTAAVPAGMAAGGLAGDLWPDSIGGIFAGCGAAILALAGATLRISAR